MGQVVDMVIHGKPMPKGRPRFSRRGSKVVTYTPRETEIYEMNIKALAQVAMLGKDMFEGPVKVTVTAYFAHKKKTGWHISRPDLDNIVKAVMDGLNGVVFADDAAVAQLVASKKYGEERVEVQIENV